MPVPAAPPDKIFAHAHYTLHYRDARRARWASGARPSYVVLFLLGGSLRWGVGVAAGGGETSASARAGRDSRPHETDDGEASGALEGEDVLLVAPEESAHASGGHGRARYLLLSLAPAYVLDCAVRAGLTRHDARISFRAPAPPRDERLAALACELVAELLGNDAGSELVISALVEQTAVHLLRRHARISRANELELSRAGLIDRRVRRAVELMHAQLGRDLPLEEIAAAAHLSPFHFSRLFKKLIGATPHAYLAALRAERARLLLSETDLSVTEVGARVGYDNPSHFAKAFRQATGLSPRAFRASLVRG